MEWIWCQWCGKRFEIDPEYNPDGIPVCDDCEEEYLDYKEENNLEWQGVIMNLDELAKKHGVASLELSKALEKAGMPQKSLWYWVKLNSVEKDYDKWELCLKMRDYKEPTFEWFINSFTEEKYYPSDVEIYYSAFNATELADVLPNGFNIYKLIDGNYRVWYDSPYSPLRQDNFPNALAKMVLYLLEKGILKKEDL